jgi:hypothetical protein
LAGGRVHAGGLVSAGRLVRGRIDGALKLIYQLGNGAVHIASDVANGSPVTRLLRMNPYGIEQRRGGDVVEVGDKRDRHPGLNGLAFRADVPQPPARPRGEDESARDRQHEGEPDCHRALPRVAHDSI